MKAEAKSAAEAEERRVFYVAATRAKELLVLSGATDLEKRPEPAGLCEPMRWVWRGFCAGLPEDGSPTGIHSDLREGRPVDVRYTLCTPATVDAVLARRPRAGAPGGGGAAVLRAAGARARRGAGAPRPACGPPQLLGPRGLPALRLPLLPRAGPPAGTRKPPPPSLASLRSTPRSCYDPVAARLDRPRVARGDRLRRPCCPRQRARGRDRAPLGSLPAPRTWPTSAA